MPDDEDLLALVARLRQGLFDVVGESTAAATVAARAVAARDSTIRRLHDELASRAVERERIVLRAEIDRVVLGLASTRRAEDDGA